MLTVKGIFGIIQSDLLTLQMKKMRPREEKASLQHNMNLSHCQSEDSGLFMTGLVAFLYTVNLEVISDF